MGVPVNIEINPDIDPREYVFDIFFEVRAKNVDLIDDDDLRDFGSFDTGMEMMNNDNMTQLVYANMTVAKMAIHRSKGYELRYCHAQDVLKIYEYGQHYLHRWAAALTSGGNLNSQSVFDKVVGDLIVLDNFCMEVFEQAKMYDNHKLTSLEQRYGVNTGFDAVRNMFSSNRKSDVQAELDRKTSTRRKGFSDLFREIQIRRDPAFGSPNKIQLNGPH